MPSSKPANTQLKGELFLTTDSKNLLAAVQIKLLIAIGDCGSISKAAKQVGISYKTAWDRIDSMNNMSNKPLVVRSAGGSKGGGTALTNYGRQVIVGFESLQQEHQLFIERLGNKLHSLTDLTNFIQSESMTSSARNQFKGQLTTITHGAVNAEIEIDIGVNQPLIAIITEDSINKLGLTEGATIVALVKASSIIVSKDTSIASSARNKLVGSVSQLISGAVNTDISIDLGDEKSVSAIITNASSDELALEVGQQACAIFKASCVILLKNN